MVLSQIFGLHSWHDTRATLTPFVTIVRLTFAPITLENIVITKHIQVQR